MISEFCCFLYLRHRDEKLELMSRALEIISHSVATSSASNVTTRTNTPTNYEPASDVTSRHLEFRPISAAHDRASRRNEVTGSYPSSRSQSGERSSQRSRSRSIEGRESGSSGSRSTADILDGALRNLQRAPVETPIEELLQQERLLQETLAIQSHRLAKKQKEQSLRKPPPSRNNGAYYSKSEVHFGDVYSSEKSSKSNHGDYLRSKSSTYVTSSYGGGPPGASSALRRGRGNFSEAIDFVRSPSKHPSEPNLYDRVTSNRVTSSRKIDRARHNESATS